MKDIIWAQTRQLLRKSAVHLVMFLLLGTYLLLMIFQGGLNGETSQTMSEFLPEVLPFLGGGAVIACTMIACFCCGADFEDKTINYELSGGRTRMTVFLGRVIPSVVIGLICAALIIFVPVAVYTALFGWGDTFTFSAILPRLLLVLVPCLRLTCLFILAVFITKKGLVGFFGCIVGMLAAVPIQEIPLLNALYKNPYALSIVNLRQLMTIDSWYTYDLYFHMHYIYYPELRAATVIPTVIVGLAVCSVSLLLAYHFFHMDDMN